MRKTYGIFRDSTATLTFTDLGVGKLEIKYEDAQGNAALVLINPNADSMTHTLDGEWKLVADKTQAGCEVISTAQGDVTLPGRSICVYVK